MKKKGGKLKWVLIVIVALFIIGTLAPKSKKEEATATKEATPSKEDLKKALKDEYGLMMNPMSVPNDVTGKWKLNEPDKHIPMPDKATEYYNAFFNSDDEVHFIIDFATNTNTRLLKLPGMLDVVIREHVDKEETNAKVMGSGMQLKHYYVYDDTGKWEEIDDTAEEAEESDQ